jgi:predicted MFS family arabinose efflux permease
MVVRRAGRSLVGTVGALRGEGRGWVVLAVAAGWLLVLGTRVVLPALLPQVTTAFAIDNATAGVVVSLIWVGYAVTQFPAGLLADRIGERRTLVASIAVTVVAVAIFALAPTFPLFVAGGVLFGLATGIYAPPRVTVLSKVFDEHEGSAIGVTFAAGNVGAALLPVVAGLLAVSLGWRWGFGFVVLPLCLVAVSLWVFLPDDPGETESGFSAPPRDVAHRLADVATHRAFLLAWLSMTLVLFTYQGITAFLPTYLVEAKGLSQGTASVVYGLFFASGATCQYLAGSVSDRFDETRVLAVIAGFGVLTLVALTVAESLVALAVVAALLGSRLGLGSVGNGYVADILPADVQGSGYGLFRTFYLAAGATGSMFVGLLASRGLFDEAFLSLAGVTALAAVLYTLLPDPDEPEYESEAVASRAVAPSGDAGEKRDGPTD